MKNNNFNATIEVEQSPAVVFQAIKEVTKWWNKEDFEGHSAKLNDEFIISHPKQHYSKQRIIEFEPNAKIVWLVTNSDLFWLKNDKEEWTNTKMIFEIIPHGNKTELKFTHEGLTPSKECYELCEQGWNMIIKDWLFHFITTGMPSPELTKAAEIRNKLLDK